MKYTIEIDKEAKKQLLKLDRKSRLQIVRKIESLAEDPKPGGCKKLYDKQKIYRIRWGNHRIIYQIKNQKLIVLVLHIGHRRDVYEKFGRRIDH